MQSLCDYFNVLTKSRIKGFLMAWGAQISLRKVPVLNILGNKLFVCVCVCTTTFGKSRVIMVYE